MKVPSFADIRPLTLSFTAGIIMQYVHAVIKEVFTDKLFIILNSSEETAENKLLSNKALSLLGHLSITLSSFPCCQAMMPYNAERTKHTTTF